MEVPTIRLNGTSKDALVEGYVSAMRALRFAAKGLRECHPHPRDYGLMDDGRSRFTIAQKEHEVRVKNVMAIHDELYELAQLVDKS